MSTKKNRSSSSLSLQNNSITFISNPSRLDLGKRKSASNGNGKSRSIDRSPRLAVTFLIALIDRISFFHLDPTTEPVRTSFSSLPSRSFRHLQEQYKDQPRPHPPLIKSNSIDTDEETSRTTSGGLRRSTDPHMPSRAFRYLQDQLPINRSLTVNNRDDLMEIYNKGKCDWQGEERVFFTRLRLVPPSIREHEPEAPRYRGSAVPSRSFRFLQKMTEDNQQTDGQLNRSFSHFSSTKSE